MEISKISKGRNASKGLGTTALDRSISLKFSLGTRLDSKFFEPLIDFPTFLVQKFWP